ncbi:MAG: hypothetical protein WB729_11185 [Candidatus Sulfotelmatobacter sp.]
MKTSIIMAVLILTFLAAGFSWFFMHRPAALSHSANTTPVAGHSRPTSSTVEEVQVNDASNTSSSSEQQVPSGWRSVTSDEYRFKMSYPEDSLPGGIAQCRVRASTLFAIPCVTDFYFPRTVDGDCCEEVTIVVSVADRLGSPTLSRWMTLSNPAISLTTIPQGKIAGALAEAYLHPQIADTPVQAITQNEEQQSDLSVLGLGAITNGGGELSYATLLTQSSSQYVYVIELVLQFDKAATSPSDNQIINTYNQMLSSFVIES